jgi:hypothetical protein
MRQQQSDVCHLYNTLSWVLPGTIRGLAESEAINLTQALMFMGTTGAGTLCLLQETSQQRRCSTLYWYVLQSHSPAPFHPISLVSVSSLLSILLPKQFHQVGASTVSIHRCCIHQRLKCDHTRLLMTILVCTLKLQDLHVCLLFRSHL